MKKVTIKESNVAKIEDNMKNRVERAVDWDVFQASLPQLKVVENLYGMDKAGLTIPLDPKYKVAIHEFPDGKASTVPMLRTDSYKELSHDYIFETLHNCLDQAGLGHKILRPSWSGSSGELSYDILLDKAYKMDEDAFEKHLGIKYTEQDDLNRGLYRPVIRIKSSFLVSSSIQMGLLRVVCGNGLIGVDVSKDISRTLKFAHIGEVVNSFNQRVDGLVTSLFEKNIIENMMKRLSSESFTFETVVTWMLAHIGKQATLASIGQYGLETKPLEAEVNKWIAYNMISWAIGNVISSVNRRDRAQTALSSLMI